MNHPHDDIRKQLRDIIELQLGYVIEKEVPDESELQGELGLDSLDCIELILEIEEEFNIVIPEADEVGLTTFGACVSYIAERKAGK